LQAPGEVVEMPVEREEDEAVDITKDERGFTTMVRNAVWKIVRFLAFKQYERAEEALSEASDTNDWTAERFAEALAPYWAEYGAIQIGPNARSGAQVQVERRDADWLLTQILLDPDEHRSWHLRFRVDLDASREAGATVLTLQSLGD
ncbi:MAG: DUF3516 domain-containing protein, partial [Myxococcales bacterium]|nr:DUF3516 domain-containing protein [Myxococcales bacterium]